MSVMFNPHIVGLVVMAITLSVGCLIMRYDQGSAQPKLTQVSKPKAETSGYTCGHCGGIAKRISDTEINCLYCGRITLLDKKS